MDCTYKNIQYQEPNLKIDVAASCNQLLRDWRKAFKCRAVERRETILLRKIESCSSADELLRDNCMPISKKPITMGRVVERSSTSLVLKMDITVRCKKLFPDGMKLSQGRDVEGREPIICLNLILSLFKI